MQDSGLVFEAASQIVVREEWDGLLWSARPVVVVSDDGEDLVHWNPAGTVGCVATSRSVPGRGDLPAAERQLLSLETRTWHYRGLAARGTSLTFVRTGSWASVAPTWFPDGRFAHWYVNFQQPIERRADGYDTLDLVIDIVVAPDGSWVWKDVEHFQAARKRGIFGSEIEDAVHREAERLVQAIEARSGPFSASWTEWRAPQDWAPPELPTGFAAGARTPPDAEISLSIPES
jgi:protein associated with RNAse G/E